MSADLDQCHHEQAEAKALAEPAKHPPRKRRRWFQFGISSLLLVTFCVATFFAWVAFEKRKHQRREQFLAQIPMQVGGSYSLVHGSTNWLEDLVGIKRMRVMSIVLPANHKLHDDGLSWLRDFPDLRNLDLEHSQNLQSQALEEIARLRYLRRLALSYRPGEAWNRFETAKPLEELSLQGRPVGGQVEVRRLPEASKVKVDLGESRPASLVMRSLPNIEVIQITGAPYPVVLDSLPRLEHATFRGCWQEIELRDLPALEQLHVGNGGTNPSTVNLPRTKLKLANLRALKKLDAGHAELTPESWAAMSSLESLKLDDCSPPQVWGDFGDRVPTNLVLRDLPDVKDIEMSGSVYPVVLQSLPRLERATFRGCRQDIELRDLPALESLHVFNGGTNPSNVNLPRTKLTLANVPSLKKLDAGQAELTPESWAAMSSLESLKLNDCAPPQLNTEQWCRLRQIEVIDSSFDGRTEGAVDLSWFFRERLTLDRLESLSILGWAGDETPIQLPSARRLEEMSLGLSGVHGALEISDFPQLTKLNLNAGFNLDGDSTSELTIRDLPQLTELHIESAGNIKLQRLSKLVNFTVIIRYLVASRDIRLEDLESLTTAKFEGQCQTNEVGGLRLHMRGLEALRDLHGKHVEAGEQDWRELSALQSLNLQFSGEPLLSIGQWSRLRYLKLTWCPLTWHSMVGLLFAQRLERRSIELPRAPPMKRS